MRRLQMALAFVVAGASLGLFWTSAAAALAPGDGGAGTYTASGTTYFFDLYDAGTTPWQYFVLVGPPGTRFVGGGTSAESAVACVPGQPNGVAESIECGPLAPTVMRPGAHLLLVGTLTATVACGARFELDVSSDGVQPFTRGGDLMLAGSCSSGSLRALTPPRIHGIARAGHTLTASAPTWSATPARVTYQWQRCTPARCAPIQGATTRSLRLTRRLGGGTVRIVAAASLNGATATSASQRVSISVPA